MPEIRLNYRDGTRDELHDISHIARDREAVYFYGTRLKGARPENFRDLATAMRPPARPYGFLTRKR